MPAILCLARTYNTRALISLNRNKLNTLNLRYAMKPPSMRLIFEAITNKRYLYAKQANRRKRQHLQSRFADVHFHVDAIVMRPNINKRH